MKNRSLAPSAACPSLDRAISAPLLIDTLPSRPKRRSALRRAFGFWLDLGASVAIVALCAAFWLELFLL